MILVEITAPSLGSRYDFELEETAPVDLLTREVVEVICQKEHLQPSEKAQNFALYSQDDACLLNSAGSLQQNGVGTGHRLLLL